MRRTHLRTVSGVGPSFSATEAIASHCEPQCRWASKTIRTARSRISSGYFPDVATLSWLHPLKGRSLRNTRGGSLTPGPRAWAELCRDVVALANSGGGVVLFGVDDDGTHLGLGESLLAVLDPAKVTDQLRRKAPSAAISTRYVEDVCDEQLYGALIVRLLDVPLVFDTEWGYNTSGGKHRIVIRPGALYVRTPGKSAPAQQGDVRELWQRSVNHAAEKVLARIEQVVSLPLDAELIVTDPDDPDRGRLLVDQGEGRSVQIISDPSAPGIAVHEVVATDAPYGSVANEVASQVRRWQQTEPEHVVSKNALIKWWFQRAELPLDLQTAEFCLRSATHNRGYPMFWASVIEPPHLREILQRELDTASAIPCQAYSYVAGVFFWDEREEILQKHIDRLSQAPRRAIEKVLESDSYPRFLTSVRWSSRLTRASERIAMAELLADRARAAEIYSELLRADLDRTITQSESGFARQLDLVVHTPY